jgi:hypothetical protein
MKQWECPGCGRSGSCFEYTVLAKRTTGIWKITVKCVACAQVTTFMKHGVFGSHRPVAAS